MLFVFAGQAGENQEQYIQSICSEAFEVRQAFNICFVSWRGMSGLKLVTPKIHNAMAVEDEREPIQYVYEKYCRPSG